MTDVVLSDAVLADAAAAAAPRAAAKAPKYDGRLDWPAALRALRKLLADKNDTRQVFEIMRALNGQSTDKGFQRLLKTPDGGRLAYEHVELAQRLVDRAYVESFAPGTVGAAYRAFLDQTGYSADGLAEISQQGVDVMDIRHPVAWFGRRTRDVHDLWHVLTGYKADEGLGEACLVAFSYAQTGGLGWAAIAAGAAGKALKANPRGPHAKAIWEGYRLGKRAAWLLGEDYDRVLAEPLDAARARLNIGRPTIYQSIPDHLRDTAMGF